MTASLDTASPLTRYSVTAQRAARQVIEAYSSSFGTASRLLGRRHRAHIRNIYALVRVADELVDGAAAEAGVDAETQHRMLDDLIAETATAVETGFSTNLIVHAFALTARASGIGADLTDPFFASMRADLPPRAGDDAADPDAGAVGAAEVDTVRYGEDAHRRYVYGSAEVVGLMCLRVFVRDEQLDTSTRGKLEHGARQLGAAFQNINFLRDLADDTSRLGRSYLSERERLTEGDRDCWVRTVCDQLRDAAVTLPLLPFDARLAVRSALELFAAVAERVADTPVDELYRTRISLRAPAKARVLARAVAATSGVRA